MNQQGGSPVSVQKFQPFVFQKFQDKTIKARGRHLQKKMEVQTRGSSSSEKSAWNINKTGTPNFQVWIRNKINKCTLQGQDPRRGLHVLKNINRKKMNMVGMKTFRGKNLWPICSKIIAVKPNWERFWRFVNRQGSGVPNEEPTIGSNRREEQPLGEEHHPEEPDQETSSWDNYQVIAGRCVSAVKKVVGLAKEYLELAEFRHEALSTAIGRLVQVLADAYRVTESVVKDRFQLESVLPFLEKKNIPEQEDHPEEEEPRGILKRGNRSKRGNSKPKRVHFWDESPPILKVLRVQDHHGHVTQVHSSGKEEPIPKTILAGGQEKYWDLDCARSNRKEHRAAEDVPRSGPTETRDQVAVRGMEFLGSVVKMGEIQIHSKPSKGIAPQPMGTQGDQKEKEVRILLQVGNEKEKKRKRRIKKG